MQKCRQHRVNLSTASEAVEPTADGQHTSIVCEGAIELLLPGGVVYGAVLDFYGLVVRAAY